MRLGFAVKVLGGGGLPSHDTRRWQSGAHLRVSLRYLRDDVMLEAKGQGPGALRLRHQMAQRGSG